MHPRSVISVCLPLAAALLCIASSAFAQETNARISGLITDGSKAVIPGVDVIAVNADTGVHVRARSNGSGVYFLPSLPVGDYRVEVDHVGFKSIVRPGITLHVQDALELNFEMALGSSSETVTASGDSNNTNTTDASWAP